MNRACDPKVDHDRVALSKKDIFGLHIAVYDAVPVRVVQRFGDFAGET